MSLIDKRTGFCEVLQKQVEILMVAVKKTKSRPATTTPVRCQSSQTCPRGSFCRFVNPLTTRVPVVFESETGAPGNPAAAS